MSSKAAPQGAAFDGRTLNDLNYFHVLTYILLDYYKNMAVDFT